MSFFNSHYFNIYPSSIKLIALLICGFWFVSCNKKETQQILTAQNEIFVSESAVDINTASVEELEKLPNIGTKLARKIIEHREKYGKFRKAEYLILVKGISDRRFRQMRHLIKIQ